MTPPADLASPWDRIHLVQGDITRFDGDAIVNAANESLLGGGGVDGAIHRAAGPRLLEECRTLGGCPCGEARITKAYNLPCKVVIHTVGPVYRDGNHGEPERLTSCHTNSLQLATDNTAKTLAFPAISCGVYGYPIEDAARIALSATADFLREHTLPESVTFMLFSPSALGAFERVAVALRA